MRADCHAKAMASSADTDNTSDQTLDESSTDIGFSGTDESCSDFNFTDTDDPTESGTESDAQPVAAAINPCKYYNDGHCRYGKKCRDPHVCKYFLRGSCRHGASCHLSHLQGNQGDRGRPSQRRRTRNGSRGQRRRSSSSSSVDSDGGRGRPYRWQLDVGQGWVDVANDHVLEAQYSQPNVKGIRIFNTPCGVIFIDFTKMQVLKKSNIKVRRKGSSQTEWMWFYRGDHGWYRYGEKDSKGTTSSVQSSELEREFKLNSRGSFSFTVSSTPYEIRFTDMSQKNLTTGHRRKVMRRPKCEITKSTWVTTLTAQCSKLMSSLPKGTAKWQFSGQNGHWHSYNKDVCSISSDDIEVQYQRNPKGSMKFTAKGQSYSLDFASMRQTNLMTNRTRRVQRV